MPALPVLTAALALVCCHQAGARESSKCAVPAAKGEAEAGGALMLQQYLARDRASKLTEVVHLPKFAEFCEENEGICLKAVKGKFRSVCDCHCVPELQNIV